MVLFCTKMSWSFAFHECETVTCARIIEENARHRTAPDRREYEAVLCVRITADNDNTAVGVCKKPHGRSETRRTLRTNRMQNTRPHTTPPRLACFPCLIYAEKIAQCGLLCLAIVLVNASKINEFIRHKHGKRENKLFFAAKATPAANTG